MKLVVLIGRILFSLIFIFGAFGHFTSGYVAYGESMGVPGAAFLVPLSGVIALVGGLSVLLGYKARWGAWLLVIFLVPVTFMMHRFWSVGDPVQMMMQKAFFMKNLSMLGAALLIAYFGSGPMSLKKEK